MTETKYYANHNTDRRVWCAWSYTNSPADAKPEDRCPAGCETSRVITGPEDKLMAGVPTAQSRRQARDDASYEQYVSEKAKERQRQGVVDMSSKVKVVAVIGLSRSTVVNAFDVAEAVTPWFPEAPEEVVAAVAELQARLDRGQDIQGLEAYLGIRVEPYEG